MEEGAVPKGPSARLGNRVVGGNQGVALRDGSGIASLDQDVGLAHGVGGLVQFLAVHAHIGRGIVFVHPVFEHGKRAARAAAGVAAGDDASRGAQVLFRLGGDQVHSQLQAVARAEVLTSGLVGHFGELAQQLFVDIAHFGIGHHLGPQVHLAEFLHDQKQQVLVVQLAHNGAELEVLEDIQGVRRELAPVIVQVGCDMVGIVQQLFHVEQGKVVKSQPAGVGEELFLQRGSGELLMRLQHRLLGGSQHAVHAPQHREGQDDIAVFVLLVVAAQQFCNGPDHSGLV